MNFRTLEQKFQTRNFLMIYEIFPSSCPYFCTNPGIPEVMDLLVMPKVFFPFSFFLLPYFSSPHSLTRNILSSCCHFSFFPISYPIFFPTFFLLLKPAHLPNPSAFTDKLIWSHLGRALISNTAIGTEIFIIH